MIPARGMDESSTFSNICSLTLRTSDGREQNMVAYIPNDQIRRHYISKANKAGLGIEIKSLNG